MIEITTNACEVLRVCPSTIIIKPTSRYLKGGKVQSGKTRSGLFLLFLTIVPEVKGSYSTTIDGNFAKMIHIQKQCYEERICQSLQ